VQLRPGTEYLTRFVRMQRPCWNPHEPTGPLQMNGACFRHSVRKQVFASALPVMAKAQNKLAIVKE
jgi:hypothetical protein